MTRRRSKGTPPVNRYAEYHGRRYRVCFHGERADAHVLIVAVKLARGGERALDIEGRIGRKVVAIARGACS